MKPATLRRIRQVHNYLAVFFAPALLFFAFTGGLQTTGLFDAHDGPVPRWIGAITSLHTDQVVAPPGRRPPLAMPDAPARAAPAGENHDGDDHDHGGFNPLKPFVVLLSVALFVTTALGLVIALTNRASRRLSLILTAAGVVMPLLLLL